jgi:hypothetical protein
MLLRNKKTFLGYNGPLKSNKVNQKNKNVSINDIIQTLYATHVQRFWIDALCLLKLLVQNHAHYFQNFSVPENFIHENKRLNDISPVNQVTETLVVINS